MKLIKIFLKYLNLKSKKLKTSQFLDIDNSFKFSKGDFVIIFGSNANHFSVLSSGEKIPFAPTAKIIKSEVGIKEPIYIVELYGATLRFPESVLKHINSDDERDWKLKKLLNENT